jgi:hypothetical protein
MNEDLKKLRQAIIGIIKPLRLRCDFILRNGDRAGKKCAKLARKTKIKGVGNLDCNLCWRHRKLIKKEYIVDIKAEDS